MPTDLHIRIAIVGPLREKVLACMRQIRPAMVGELRGLLIDVANRTTRRASGDVLKVRSGHLRRSIGPPTPGRYSSKLPAIAPGESSA